MDIGEIQRIVKVVPAEIPTDLPVVPLPEPTPVPEDVPEVEGVPV